MAKTKISEFNANPALNTDIDSINISEGCAPSGINDAIRELMAQLKDFQTGAVGDSFNGPIGTSTAAAGAFTTLSATGAITSTLATGTAPLVIASTTKVANLNVDLLDGSDWASPAALGSTTPAAVSATTLSASGAVTLSGGTANGVTYLNGSKVLTSGSALTFDGTSLGVGTSSPAKQLDLAANNTGITTGDPLNTLRFTDTDTTSAAGQPMGRIEWYSSDADTAGVKAYIQAQSTDGSPDADMVFATNHVSGGGTAEKMRIQYDGNVGIGTTSPVARLHVNYTSSGLAPRISGSGLARFDLEDLDQADGSRPFQYLSSDGGSLIFGNSNRSGTSTTSSVERMRIDSSGNVGIGTSSPAQKLDVYGTGMKVNNASYVGYLGAGNTFAGGAASDFCVRSDNVLSFATGGPYERARIDLSGNLLVNQTSGADGKLNVTNGNGGTITTLNSGGTDPAYAIQFKNPNGTIGNITVSGSSTAYNTSSDYRLKNTIAPMTGALAKVALLKPCTYKWNSDGSDGQGFIAHELAEVVPQCVTGEKDAVDEEGNPKYQGIDTSFLVATVVAALQELKAEFDAYKASHP